LLQERYDWVLGGILADIDALVLTVVERYDGINMSNPEGLKKIVDPIYAKCRQYNKKLILRTFLYRPGQLEDVKNCLDVLPDDIIVMSKVIPLDWHLRGIGNPVIGQFSPKQHFIEFDLCGEYFKLTYPALTFPEKIKRNLTFGISKGITGVCARVDRFDHEILGKVQEMNLWTLGMLSSGKTDSLDTIWKAYITETFGAVAVSGMSDVLQPTEQVLAEALCVGPFTFGNTRNATPPVAMDSSDEIGDNAFSNLWSNWVWDRSYYPMYLKIRDANRVTVENEEQANLLAIKQAEKCLKDLTSLKEKLPAKTYSSLQKHLKINLYFIRTMHHVQMAYLRLKQLEQTADQRLQSDIQNKVDRHIASLRQLEQETRSLPFWQTTEGTFNLVDIKQWLIDFDVEYQARTQGLKK
jgi:hypothetical protein